MARVDTLKNFLTDIADKLRVLLDTTEPISHADYDTKIGEAYNKAHSVGAFAQKDAWIARIGNWSYLFMNDINETVLPVLFENADTTKYGTRFTGMFDSRTTLTEAPLINTSNGTAFNSMFRECQSLKKVPELDTSKGTTFRAMFFNCHRLTQVPLLNTGNGTDFTNMLYGCETLAEIPAFDTSNGIYFDGMVRNCYCITTMPVLDTSKGTSFRGMYYYCWSLKGVYEIDMRNSKDSSNLFAHCTALTDLTFKVINEDGTTTGAFNVYGNITNAFTNTPALTADSLVNLLNAFSDNSKSETYTVTLGNANLAKLTEEQKAIATAKNITLA